MTALLVPLVYSNATIDPVLPLRFLIVSLLGLVLVTAFGVRIVRTPTTLSLRRSEALVFGFLVAYTIVATVALVVAGPTPDGIFGLLKIAVWIGLIYASARAIDGDPNTLAFLAKCVITSSFLVGGFALLQYYQIAVFEWMKRDTTVDSTMAHRNLLASFVLLSLPYVAFGWLELHGLWRWASAATFLGSTFLLAVLQTRSVWVAFPAGLAGSLLVLAAVSRLRPLADRSHAYRRRILAAAALMGLALGLALLFYAPGARAPMLDHVGSLVQTGNASIQERLQLWSRTLRMIRDHPLTGVGLGNWRVVIPTYGMEGLRADTGTLHFQRPHNDWLWVASETGVLGGILYVGIFASVLGVAVAAMLRAQSPRHRMILTLMLFGLIGYVVDSLFSFPMERISHSVYLALVVGTVLSHSRGSGRPQSRGAGELRPAFSLGHRWTLAIVVLAWGTMGRAALVAASRYSAEVHLRRALEARAVRDWPRMAAQLDRIDRRFYAMDPSSAPVIWYRGVAHFEMGDTTAAMADFRSALEVHPHHAHVLNNIATCQTLRREYDEAIGNYRRAIEVAPRFEAARVNLGALLHSLGRDQEAYDVLEPCVAYATSARFAECFRSVKAALGLRD